MTIADTGYRRTLHVLGGIIDVEQIEDVVAITLRIEDPHAPAIRLGFTPGDAQQIRAYLDDASILAHRYAPPQPADETLPPPLDGLDEDG